MPVRKPAAKSAAKPLAKKIAAAKKPVAKKGPAKKSASSPGDSEIVAFAKRIAGTIEDGDFDGGLVILDEAITARINKQAAAKKRAAKSASNGAKEKSVSPAPKRKGAAAAKEVVPEPGKSYKISGGKLDGAKVKFIKFGVKDDTKAQIEMQSDKPGFPKGKRAMIALSALRSLR